MFIFVSLGVPVKVPQFLALNKQKLNDNKNVRTCSLASRSALSILGVPT